MDLGDMRPLPPEAVMALRAVEAPPRLLAHLLLAHDVAARLVEAAGRTWPRLHIDGEAVRLGAATHDIGKALHPDEVTGPGARHAASGERLLLEQGFAPGRALRAHPRDVGGRARGEHRHRGLARRAGRPPVEGRPRQRA